MDATAQWFPQAWRLQAGHTAYLPLAAGDWLVASHGPLQLYLQGGAGLLPEPMRLDSGDAWQAPARGWVRVSSASGAEWVHWANPAGTSRWRGWRGLRGLLRQVFPGRSRALAASRPAA